MKRRYCWFLAELSVVKLAPGRWPLLARRAAGLEPVARMFLPLGTLAQGRLQASGFDFEFLLSRRSFHLPLLAALKFLVPERRTARQGEAV